jgi:formylglycine-generating enzyme required for sulfatase activity
MADRLPPKGFWSYTTSDDLSAGGHLTELRIRLANRLQLEVGKPKVVIFQDKHAIPIGADWKKKIYGALDEASFILPIVTPGFIQSEWCCNELLYFSAREKALGREDLIFPFIYVDIERIDPDQKDDCYNKDVYHLLRARQHFDFHDRVDHDVGSEEVKQRIAYLAKAIHNALRQHVPVTGSSPEPAPKVTAPKQVVAISRPPPRDSPKPGTDEAPRPAAPEAEAAGALTIIRDHEDAPELIRIPKGTFTMGVSPKEEECEGVPKEFRGWSTPRQSVTIPSPFWLGRYPVTRAQFATFIAETGHETANEAWTFEPDNKGQWTYERRTNRDRRNPGFQQTDNDPVVCVSYEDAIKYIEWLRALTGKEYRLPSESEWEYAARAGTTTARFWGDGRVDAVQFAKVADRTLMRQMKQDFDPERFFDGESDYPFTAPVGAFLPNQFGLYDMLGNVWEWTADVFNATLKGIPLDGSPNTTGDSSRRVVRGGSWSNSPRDVRAGDLDWGDTGSRSNGTGFRVARTLFYPES